MHAHTRAWFSQWRIHFFLLLPQVRQLTELGVTVTSTKPAIVKSNPYNEGVPQNKGEGGNQGIRMVSQRLP